MTINAQGGSMRAVEISSPGGPEVLRLVQRPIPSPGQGEVLIRVAAAGVNGHDLHHRHDGSHPLNPGESDLPGLEVAGWIAEAAPDTGWRVGERVCALLRGGGYAEYCIASAQQCLRPPEGLSLLEAASLPEACFTVWSNVFMEARLKAGERFLMNGGSSGIGVTAIQIASRLGAEVYATAGGPAKCELCRELGAVMAVDYQQDDFLDALRAATGGQGVDVILEIVGGDYLPRDIKLLRLDGRLMIIGAARGLSATVDFMDVVRKRLIVTGSTLRPRSPVYKARIASEIAEHVWPLYGRGEIRPVIHSVFELADAADAHTLMEGRGHAGKVMLRIAEADDA